ncbi:hypothetical protein [Bacillus marinisedimentorum]|uniref:hypothetical protein n=1 Tax=Bacillus marinisedimentorum TaxID=1821260 RepID=UPI000AF14020|nr:hypothetical protein [Bacillus marinisedimentorum]
MNDDEKCYCLEIFRSKYGDHVQGDCLKWSCGRYRIEKRKEKEGKKEQASKKETP